MRMKRLFGALLVVVACALLGTSLQATEGYTLAVGSTESEPGEPFTILVDGLWAQEVMGYTIAVQFPALPPIDDLTISIDNTLVAELMPEFAISTVSLETGEAIVAVLFELLPPFDLVLEPLGFPVALAELSGTVSAGTEPQTIAFDLVDGIGSPPVNNIFVVNNQSLPPESLSGGELIVNAPPPMDPYFVRGDVTMDGVITIADVIFYLIYTFQGGPAPQCDDAADSNDDGGADITDGIFTLAFLFQNGPTPWPPYPSPGPDYTPDNLDCESTPF